MGQTGRALTQAALDCLLRMLDPDRDRAGEQYELLRRRLVLFFRARGIPHPEEGADETLTVAAVRLVKGEAVQNVTAYALGIARLVAFERHRAEASAHAAAREASVIPAAEDDEQAEERQRAFNECLAQLPADQRDLILAYYSAPTGEHIERRKRLAAQYGIPANALRIRAHRIRQQVARAFHAALEKKR